MAGYTIAELPMEEISMGRSRADRAAIDSAVQRGQRPPGMAKNPTHTPALDRVSSQMQAKPAKPGAIKTIAKGGVYLAAGSAVADSAAEDSTARYAQRFGVSEPTGDGSVGDIAKFAALRAGGFASDLGNNLTMGLAGKFYRDNPGGSQAAAAQPVEQPAPAQQPAAAAQPAATTAAPRPPGIPSIAVKLPGYEQGNADIYATSNGANGKPNGFAGVGDPNRLNWEQRNPADYQAAVARAEADKAKLAEIERSKAGPAISMGLPQTFGEMMQFRAQMAMNRLNQRADEANMHNQNDRARIAAGLVQSPYDQERTRGAKIENDRASMLSGLVGDYMNAKDDKTRTAALAKLNALNGKDGADKYITVDMEAGVDAAGNPITRKVPFNTRTGQIVDVSGGGAAQAGAAQGAQEHQEGDKLRGSDGKAYIWKNGQAVLVK